MVKGTLYSIVGASLLTIAGFIGRQVWTMNADVSSLKTVLQESKIIDFSERVRIVEKETENQWALLRDLNDGIKEREVEVEVLKKINTSVILPFISGNLSLPDQPFALLPPELLTDDEPTTQPTTQPSVQNLSVIPNTAVAPNTAAVNDLKQTIDDAKSVLEQRREEMTAQEFKDEYVQQRKIRKAK